MSVAIPVVNSWDGENRRAYLKQGVTAFHWIDDVYKEYRYWRRTVEAARVWDALMIAAGNNPKGGGKYTPRYITLLHGFRVIPYDENILIVVTGEAITDNPEVDPDPFDTSTRTQPLKLYITPPASELVRAEAEIAAVNRMSYNEEVRIDQINGLLGTDGLKGNKQYPVRLLLDALIIADNNGFIKLNIKDDFVFTAGDDVSGLVLIGEGESSTLITLPVLGGALTVATKMEGLTLTGKCGGRLIMDNCCLDTVTALCATGGDAFFYNTRLKNTIQLNTIANRSFNFVNCDDSGTGTPPVIDVNDSPASVNFNGYSGFIKFINCTQNIDVRVMLNSGGIILDSSVEAGTFTLAGNGTLADNSTGTTINKTGLMNNAGGGSLNAEQNEQLMNTLTEDNFLALK